MDNGQNAILDALQRAQRFLDENAALLTSADFISARWRLDEIVKSFATHAFDQNVGDRGAKEETARQRELCITLRYEQMKPIAVIARRSMRFVPEFTALQMPKWGARAEAFLWAARGMLDAAAVHRDTLVAHGMPATFLDDFRVGLANLAVSLNEQKQHRSRRAAATNSLAFEAQHGRTVLSVLDALVHRAARGNESLLRSWQLARLIDLSGANATTAAA
jgi:hypothetical protein